MRIERYLTPPAPPRGAFSHPALALGFRPFFLMAGLTAVLLVPTWLVVWHSGAAMPPAMQAMHWHGHEMLYGFATAVVAGFLLTAVRNWTGQPTPTGGTLAALATLWLLGRVAMLTGGHLPPALVGAVDSAFLPALAAAITGPIARSRNRRNYAMPVLLVVLAAVHAAFHFGGPAWQRPSLLLGLDLFAVLLAFMGGRVIPFFTQNAVPTAAVATPAWLAWAAILTTLAIPAARLTGDHSVLAAASLAAGAANLARLAGWRPWRTRHLPILWVLHLGYLWLAVGLLLSGVSPWHATLGVIGLHALAIGALGTLVLGMMARVSLGHTGRRLVAPPTITAAFALLQLAALVRVLAPLLVPQHYSIALITSGVCWSAAFGLFVLVYAPILTTPRADGAPG